MIPTDLKQKLIESTFIINNEDYSDLIRNFIKTDNLNSVNNYYIKLIQIILNKAICYKQTELVELLLKNGADPNYEIDVEIPIIHAIRYNMPEIAELLLKYGTRPDRKYISSSCYYSGTLIIFATRQNRLEIVKLLMQYNADLSLQDSEGKTALDAAKDLQYDDIVNEIQMFINYKNKSPEELLSEARKELKKYINN